MPRLFVCPRMEINRFRVIYFSLRRRWIERESVLRELIDFKEDLMAILFRDFESFCLCLMNRNENIRFAQVVGVRWRRFDLWTRKSFLELRWNVVQSIRVRLMVAINLCHGSCVLIKWRRSRFTSWIVSSFHLDWSVSWMCNQKPSLIC